MKIYFAGSICGGREDQELYLELISYLEQFGQVLTEHIGDKKLSASGENIDKNIVYKRDSDWVKEADLIIAEVSTPSLGVGYELGLAESLGKKILCLHRKKEGKSLSKLVSGNQYLIVREYTNLDDAKRIIEEFLKTK